MKLLNFVYLVASLLSSHVAAQCSCPTATVTARPSGCPAIRCGPHPMCVQLKKVTVTQNPVCFYLPTVTTTLACPSCQKGCRITTQTATEACHNSVESDVRSVSTASSCYTYTSFPQAPVCPGLSCPVHPNCAMLSTRTLPPFDPNCPTTPVVVATPSCLPTCRTGCQTFWTTVQGSASPTFVPTPIPA